MIVDEKKKKGMFLLTDSHQFEVLEKVTQSLAGRSSVFTLLPLSLNEIYSTTLENTTDELLLRGCYPQVQAEKINPTSYYQDYISTYLERDLRQISEIRNLQAFRRFLKLSAGRIGQILDLSNLAEAVGVTQPTIKNWIDILQASYIIFLLPPYFSNIKKRLVKRPKLYFYDVGLASFLLDITETSHVFSHPLRGSLFENLVVMDAIKKRFNRHLPNNCYFYRDKNQNEVDLVCAIGNRVKACEIKSGKTINSDYFKGIRSIQNVNIELIKPSIVIYDGEDKQERSDTTVLPLKEFGTLALN